MSDKINSAKEKLINEYIKKIDIAVENYNFAIEADGEIFELILIIEITNVFEKDISNLQGNLLIRTGTELRDANTARVMLISGSSDKISEPKEILMNVILA